MTDPTLPPPPMADLVGPIMKSATLIAAGKVGLFHALADGPRSISELSKDLGASENGLACLAEALTTIGYLERQDGRFANGPTARAWLTPSSSIDFNSLLIYLEHTWRLLADLGEVVRKGSPELSFAQYMLDHPDAGSAYNEYMKGCAKLDEDFLRRTLSLPEDARRMLDLGGAHGWYTAVLCREHPNLCAVIFDVAPALAEAKNTVTDQGLGERVVLQPGNYLVDDIGEGFDVVLCFHLLHWHLEDDNRRLLRKATKALLPGGKMILMEKPKGDPPGVYDALFSVLMQLYGGSRLYRYEEITGWMTEAGLKDIERVDLPNGQITMISAAKRAGG